MRIQSVTILALSLTGFALRLYYLTTTHPFFDEYTTVLAARQVLRQGWPVLPSGLFYEHGLLATYLIAPFTALFIDIPVQQWQPAHWGLMLSRWPSLLIGTATIPLIYAIARRCFQKLTGPGPALLAAGLFALSPEGMVWGGRARMYPLATVLVLLTVFWAYRGARHPAPANFRWWALLAMLATLLTQFGAMTLVPPLLAGMLLIGWLSWRRRTFRFSLTATRPWFLRLTVFPEGFALVVIIALAVWVKRLGRPLGVGEWGSTAWQLNPVVELFNSTIAYQTTFHFSWADSLRFLARQFGVPHHFWLTTLALVGIVIGLIIRQVGGTRNTRQSISIFDLFLWLVFGLIIVEMVTLLDPFRRNPRYLVMYLPLFYLISANAIFNLPLLFQSLLPRFSLSPFISSVSALAFLTLFTFLGLRDLKVALLTPQPAYEEAFAWLEANAQPGDALLTMNTPAAGLYLGHADGFTVQENAQQFLLNVDTEAVDRWLGVPWLDTAADFSMALNAADRAWFVIDTIRQPVYFRGDWLAVVDAQMEQVWAKDNALIYRTRADRIALPSRPDTLVTATLGNSVQLTGYSLKTAGSQLDLTLFWQPLTSITADYTTFLHLRNADGITVAQRDGQPLNGAYPTSYWQPKETIVDPITLPLPEDLPAGRYILLVGLYRLDTLERLPVANDNSGENAVILEEVALP